MHSIQKQVKLALLWLPWEKGDVPVVVRGLLLTCKGAGTHTHMSHSKRDTCLAFHVVPPGLHFYFL